MPAGSARFTVHLSIDSLPCPERGRLLHNERGDSKMPSLLIPAGANPPMANNMSLRDIPDPLLAWLKEQAQRHHRSVNREVIALLEAARLGEVRASRGTVTLDELLAFRREVASLPTLSKASDEEILGIDPTTGVPR